MPKTASTRPTQDRVREAVFNVIRPKVAGSAVLDLYAGSGAFGIEALSRGAAKTYFVDNNAECARTIKENVSIIRDADKRAVIMKKDSLKAIGELGEKGLKFDLIFLDPPYREEELAKNTLIKINDCAILNRRGFLVVEHSGKTVLPPNINNIKVIKASSYGDKAVSFYASL